MGGAGGRTISVTTLADSGPGSLREALGTSGARVITFAVAGVIDLKTPIRVNQPFVTISGQTAPSPGIQIRGETLNIGTHDVIVTHMRFRPGDATADTPADADGLTINGGSGEAYNVVIDHVESYDRLLTDILSAHLASVSVKQNADMRRISAWVAIAAVPTMIAGIYGMNFENMPELSASIHLGDGELKYGYFLVLLVMVGACTGLYRAFKRSGWL